MQPLHHSPPSSSPQTAQAASQAETPRSERSFGSDLGDDARDYLRRHLTAMTDRQRGTGGSLVPAHVAAKLAQHHSVRPAPRHGMFGMGSTLVLVDQDKAKAPTIEDELGPLMPEQKVRGLNPMSSGLRVPRRCMASQAPGPCSAQAPPQACMPYTR